MLFHNIDGDKTKDEVLTIIDNHINAYEYLKKVGIKNDIVENKNDVGCVDVVEALENLKNIVNVFADEGKYNNDRIVEFHGWNFNNLFNQKIDTYEDLNKAIFDRINFLKNSLKKVETREVRVNTPITKSIDDNVKWTRIGVWVAIASLVVNSLFTFYGILVQHKDTVLDRQNQVIQQTVPQKPV